MARAFRRLLSPSGLVGLCLILLGVLADPWLLSRFLGATIVPVELKVLAVVFEILLILGGVLVALKGNTASGRKQLTFGFVALILAVLLVEGGLRIINLAIYIPDPEGSPFRVVSTRSPYEGQAWAEAYFNDLWARPVEYDQYLGWHDLEFHSESINVDASGVRRTWNPEPGLAEPASTLYIFGGSTLWGIGARDEYTIPSHLSKLLAGDGYNFRVYNYGEGAYTFTQEIVCLTLLLRDGHRPDYVIFYDGINDVFCAQGSAGPGATFRLSEIRDTLRAAWGKPSVARTILSTVSDLSKQSMICRVIAQLVNRPQGELPASASGHTEEKLQQLSAGIAAYYMDSMDLLEHLAQSYGFRYACFWQPNTCLETELTSEEASYAYRNDGAYCELHRMTADCLTAEPPPLFFDISNALANRTATCYVDSSGHLSEEGNRLVATRMCNVFEQLFLEEAAAPTASGASAH